MFSSLDILGLTGALPSSAYLGMSIAQGEFNPLAYACAVAHEEDKEKEQEKKY